MFNIGKDIHSLTAFKRRTNEFVEQLEQTKRPIVLTINGRAGVVVQDAAAYQKLLEAARRLELLEAELRQETTGVLVSPQVIDERARHAHQRFYRLPSFRNGASDRTF